MNTTYKKFYFISMQVISLVVALCYLAAGLYLLFAYFIPLISVIKEYPDVMIDISLYCFLIALFVIAFAVIMAYLFSASNVFKKAKKYNNYELVESRKKLFGYGIYTAIVCAPSILGMIVILVFAIYTNDNILELSSTYKAPEVGSQKGTEVKEKVEVKKEVKTKPKAVKADGEAEKLLVQFDVLKEMKEQGLLTEEEYLKKGKELLGME